MFFVLLCFVFISSNLNVTKIDKFSNRYPKPEAQKETKVVESAIGRNVPAVLESKYLP